MRTKQDFSERSPLDYGAHILVFIESSTAMNTVEAINISTRDKGENDLINSLSKLISVTTDILGVTRTIIPISAKNKGRYWNFEIEPFSVTTAPQFSSNVTSSFYFNELTDNAILFTDKVARFSPSPNDAGFSKSVYQAIENNSEKSATTHFIFEVDNKNDAIQIANIDAINSGTAALAEFQGTNHEQIGLVNSRYGGAKTSITDYGINSAINAKEIKAAIYVSSSTNEFICSQSDANRTIENLLFSIPESYITSEADDYGVNPTSGSRIFTLNGNQIIPLRDRKVFVESNRTIVYINQDGYAINKGTICT